MDFDQLSRGDQYLVLRNRELESLILDAVVEIEHSFYLLDRYPNAYNSLDNEMILNNIETNRRDIQYYSRLLKGGAENEGSLTESQNDSESPTNRFTGITCTTVV